MPVSQTPRLEFTLDESNKLQSVGIRTVGPDGVNPRYESVLDDLWSLWYGSRNAVVTSEQFGGDLSMGWLGSDTSALCADSPSNHAIAVAYLQAKTS